MFSVPVEYFNLLVTPSVERFLEKSTEFDLCFSACIFLTHFADVYAQHSGRSLSKVREEMRAASPSFDIVYAVGTAAKHVTINNPEFGTLKGLMAEHAHVAGGAAFSDGTYYSDGATHDDAPHVVRVKTPNGDWHDLTHEVKAVYDAIRSNFLQMG